MSAFFNLFFMKLCYAVSGGENMRILIVEDDMDLNQIIVKKLTAEE